MRRGALGLLVIAAALLTGCLKSLTPLPGDRDYVLVIEDLYLWLDPDAYPADHGVLTKRRSSFGDYELTYEYDSEEPPFYLLWELVVHGNDRRAREYFRSGGAGIWMSSALSGGAAFVRDDDFVVWGDDSQFYTVEAEGEPIGNAFLARSGRRTVLMMVGGLHFDSRESFDQAVRPRLTNALRYQPESTE